MPSYSQTLKYLNSLEPLGIRPGLKRIRALLKALGNPEKCYPSLHVAGTNGKGSTCAMLESILTEAGYKVGLYTSPHLIRFNERIRVSKRDISDRGLVKCVEAARNAVKKTGGIKPTFFEFTTAVAFHYFKKQKIDIAVIETGMGGRLDATNVLNPLVSVITSIGLDHTEYLGETLKQVAAEKAGIIKKKGIVVTGETKPSALSAIKAAAKGKNAALKLMGRDFRCIGASSGDFSYSGMGGKLKGLKLNLFGAHQINNAASALAAIEIIQGLGFQIREAHIKNGLKKVLWPGRFEVIRKRPLVILDACHNPEGAEALRDALKRVKFNKLILVAGIMADKDIGGILKPLAPITDTVIFTAPDTPRAAQAALLLEMLKPYSKPALVEDTVALACKKALSLAKPKDAVCITGSIFTIGEAKKYLAKAR